MGDEPDAVRPEDAEKLEQIAEQLRRAIEVASQMQSRFLVYMLEMALVEVTRMRVPDGGKS